MMKGENPNSGAVAKRLPKDSIGVELGVWRGDTSQKFLDSGKVKFLHLVDAWSTRPYLRSGEHGDDDAYWQRYWSLLCHDHVTPTSAAAEEFERFYGVIYQEVCRRFFGRDDVAIHRLETNEFLQHYPASNVDWVYVDASHTYSDVLRDLQGSLRILAPKGVIFGDDYGGKPGVVAAVNEFVAKHQVGFEIFAGNQYEIKV